MPRVYREQPRRRSFRLESPQQFVEGRQKSADAERVFEHHQCRSHGAEIEAVTLRRENPSHIIEVLRAAGEHLGDEEIFSRTNLGTGPATPSSFPSIEEGRFPAGTTLAGRFRILGLWAREGWVEVYRALDLNR